MFLNAPRGRHPYLKLDECDFLLLWELYCDHPTPLDLDTLAADGCYGRYSTENVRSRLRVLEMHGLLTVNYKRRRPHTWRLTHSAFMLICVGDLRGKMLTPRPSPR